MNIGLAAELTTSNVCFGTTFVCQSSPWSTFQSKKSRYFVSTVIMSRWIGSVSCLPPTSRIGEETPLENAMRLSTFLLFFVSSCRDALLLIQHKNPHQLSMNDDGTHPPVLHEPP